MKELNNLLGMGRSGSLVKTSSTLAVVLMVMATAAMPVVAGTTGQNGIVDGYIIETEHGFEKVTALMSLLFNNDSITVIRDLRSKGYELEFGKVNVRKIRSKENMSHETLLIIIPAESKNSNASAQVVFASNGERTCVANAIIEDGADYRKIDVYEINDRTEKNYVVLNRDGAISMDGETILTGVQQIGSGQVKSGPVILAQVEPKGCGTGDCHTGPGRLCSICRKVCRVIVAAECGLGAYFICMAACAGFAGFVCPIICAVVFSVVCGEVGMSNCKRICSPYCG